MTYLVLFLSRKLRKGFVSLNENRVVAKASVAYELIAYFALADFFNLYFASVGQNTANCAGVMRSAFLYSVELLENKVVAVCVGSFLSRERKDTLPKTPS